MAEMAEHASNGRTMAAMAEHPPVSNATQPTNRRVAHSRCASSTGCVHTPCPHPSTPAADVAEQQQTPMPSPHARRSWAHQPTTQRTHNNTLHSTHNKRSPHLQVLLQRGNRALVPLLDLEELGVLTLVLLQRVGVLLEADLQSAGKRRLIVLACTA